MQDNSAETIPYNAVAVTSCMLYTDHSNSYSSCILGGRTKTCQAAQDVHYRTTIAQGLHPTLQLHHVTDAYKAYAVLDGNALSTTGNCTMLFSRPC